MADGRWFPVYYEDLPKQVWHDPRLFWTWAHLLAIHDRAWPSPGDLPREATQAMVDQLVRLELVTLADHHQFTVRGLDARRTRQSNAARNAARIKHGNAPSNAEIVPNQTRDIEIRNGARTTEPRAGNGLEQATHQGRSKQPTNEERLAELRQRLDVETDPEMRMGIEATIERWQS